MMKVEVKLYSYHDMDLVGLYKTGKVSFPETTRQVLNSYARGEVYKVKLLHTNDKRLAKYPKTSLPYKVSEIKRISDEEWENI